MERNSPARRAYNDWGDFTAHIGRGIAPMPQQEARRVVVRTAQAPVDGLPLPWGRTGSFRLTNSRQKVNRRAPGPPSWRFRTRDPTVDDQDGYSSDPGQDDYAAWQQPIRRPVTRQKQKRLDTEEENKRLHEQWDACFNDNVFRHTCHQADRQALSEALRARLAGEFAAAATAEMQVCPSCNQPGMMLSASSEQQLLYVALEGRVPVPHPVFICAGCEGVHTVHPTSFGCFPATPTEPQVVYAVSLLQLTCKVGIAGPLPMEAWCNALEALHQWNGCTEPDGSAAHAGPQRVWRRLSMAAQQWQRVATSAEDLTRYSIQPISRVAHEQPGGQAAAPASPILGQSPTQEQRTEQEQETAPEAHGSPANHADQQSAAAWGPFIGPTRQCPACFETCQAVMADACMGLTHLRAAGRAADTIQPLQQQTPFLADEEIKELLVDRRDIDPASLERPMCSDFLAASKGFSNRQARLHMQV